MSSSPPTHPVDALSPAESDGSLKGKLSSEVRSKKAAILMGLHRNGDKMKRGEDDL